MQDLADTFCLLVPAVLHSCPLDTQQRTSFLQGAGFKDRAGQRDFMFMFCILGMVKVLKNVPSENSL